MKVKGEDEVVNDHCGTKHWVAPEIEEKLMYSPIKADRWSSGQVLLYLLERLREEGHGSEYDREEANHT